VPTRSQVCTWIAGFGLVVVPSLALAQERTEREVVELIVRDGPRAREIRAESEVTRREQDARLAYPNPAVTYSRESAGFTEFLQAEQSLPIFGARESRVTGTLPSSTRRFHGALRPAGRYPHAWSTRTLTHAPPRPRQIASAAGERPCRPP
jgi:hypothetical protein